MSRRRRQHRKSNAEFSTPDLFAQDSRPVGKPAVLREKNTAEAELPRLQSETEDRPATLLQKHTRNWFQILRDFPCAVDLFKWAANRLVICFLMASFLICLILLALLIAIAPSIREYFWIGMTTLSSHAVALFTFLFGGVVSLYAIFKKKQRIYELLKYILDLSLKHLLKKTNHRLREKEPTADGAPEMIEAGECAKQPG